MRAWWSSPWRGAPLGAGSLAERRWPSGRPPQGCGRIDTGGGAEPGSPWCAPSTRPPRQPGPQPLEKSLTQPREISVSSRAPVWIFSGLPHETWTPPRFPAAISCRFTAFPPGIKPRASRVACNVVRPIETPKRTPLRTIPRSGIRTCPVPGAPAGWKPARANIPSPRRPWRAVGMPGQGAPAAAESSIGISGCPSRTHPMPAPPRPASIATRKGTPAHQAGTHEPPPQPLPLRAANPNPAQPQRRAAPAPTMCRRLMPSQSRLPALPVHPDHLGRCAPPAGHCRREAYSAPHPQGSAAELFLRK
ncbi:hypothetical protein ABH937_003891 [Kitasatospora sp. GAS1066B]